MLACRVLKTRFSALPSFHSVAGFSVPGLVSQHSVPGLVSQVSAAKKRGGGGHPLIVACRQVAWFWGAVAHQMFSAGLVKTLKLAFQGKAGVRLTEGQPWQKLDWRGKAGGVRITEGHSGVAEVRFVGGRGGVCV